MITIIKNHIHIQPIGQRIVKTSIAVTLCMLFYMLRGYTGDEMPAEAAITAIICMSTNVRGTRDSAYSRMIGTLLGAFWGFLYLISVPWLPTFAYNRWAIYLLMGVGTLLALYSAVLLKKADAAGLSAIVFICVVVNYPYIENPLDQAFHRLIDVLIGTVTAVVINAIHLPRKKRYNKVFFVQLKDLAMDQFSQLPTTVLYRLQYLFSEGAKICLMSEHAPAFQTSQLGEMNFTVPMIVMDGAALYDAKENVYLSITSIDNASCRWLMKRLENMDVSYFVYTIHRDRNCIFHHGTMTESENIVYQQVKRSPYRYYLDNDRFSMADVVYLKIVGENKELEQIRNQLQSGFEKMKLRAVIREQAGLKNGSSLYFYAASANMENAQKKLMHLLSQKESGLEVHEMHLKKGYRTEKDAVQLVRRVTREYEPFIVSYWLEQLKNRKKTALIPVEDEKRPEPVQETDDNPAKTAKEPVSEETTL